MLSCSLNRVAMHGREHRWRRLGESALLESSCEPERALMRFRDQPQVAEELRELVRLERECCPFLDFTLTEQEGSLELLIEGPPEAAAMLESFAGPAPDSAVNRSS